MREAMSKRMIRLWLLYICAELLKFWQMTAFLGSLVADQYWNTLTVPMNEVSLKGINFCNLQI